PLTAKSNTVPPPEFSGRDSLEEKSVSPLAMRQLRGDALDRRQNPRQKQGPRRHRLLLRGFLSRQGNLLPFALRKDRRGINRLRQRRIGRQNVVTESLQRR